MKKYDAIIIGSGQSGTPLSKKLASAGWKTALIEKRFTGGTCINDGCTPTKTMIASAKIAGTAKKSSEFGINIHDVSINIKRIIERKNEVVQSFRESTKKGLLQTEGLDIFFGEASFTGIKTVYVRKDDGNTVVITADYIFIDTGGKPFIPTIRGLDTIPCFTSTTILDITDIPDHLLILGGSYIGLEFGQMFKRFGSKITILDTAPRFLPNEDEDIADAILDFMKKEDVIIHTNTKATGFTKQNDTIQAEVEVNGNKQTIKCTHVLAGTGRIPQTAALQLDKTGVQTDEKGYIKVNQKLETNVPGIYALGDVKGGPAFTHISYNDYVVVYKNLIEKENISIDHRMVPYCMFTDPQLGRVGITEQEARRKDLNIKVATLPVKNIARAIETDETAGLLKAVVDADSKLILGAAALAEQGGEIMAMIQIAMMGNVTYEILSTAIFAHPTYAESLNNLFGQLK